MLCHQYLALHLPPVRPNDPADRVLEWMEACFVPHLPVVDGRELLGILSASLILSAENPQVPIRELPLIRPEGHFVYAEQHVYDAISLLTATGHSIVPVLDEENQYIGAIGREEALKCVSGFTGLSEPGGIVVLALKPGDYQLRQIADIAESSDAKILSLHLMPSPDDPLAQWLTLKLNIRELSALRVSFERFGYRIVFAFYDQKQLDDTQDRYAALMNYLKL